MSKKIVARRGLGVFLSMVLCFWMGTPVFAEELHQKFRFKDHGSGTVTDHVTGLEWVKCPHVLSGNSRAMSWNRAVGFCSKLNYAGYSDWRLPNVKEAESLVNCGGGTWGTTPQQWLNSMEPPFDGIQSTYYWSSIPHLLRYPSGNSCLIGDDCAWGIFMGSGRVSYSYKTDHCFVWPVRGGLENGALSPLEEKVHADRFSVQGDVVIDQKTGVEWARNPGRLDERGMTWHNAIEFCENFNLAGRSGWRLPSRAELLELMEYEEDVGLIDIFGYTGHYPNLGGNPYWSNTPLADNTNRVWCVLTGSGVVSTYKKTLVCYVWPVRDGQ